jgi:N-acetylneuraminic acid mutarotase
MTVTCLLLANFSRASSLLRCCSLRRHWRRARATGRRAPPCPRSDTEVAVVEVGSKIYVLGGFRGELELEIYDPTADRWSRGAAIPRAVHHAAAVGLNGRIYLIGGYVDGWMPTDEVHEYDAVADSWRARARMPTPRGALAAAVIDGKIHAVSGTSWRDRNTSAHEVYDPDANRWTALAAIPTPRDHLAVAAVDGRLYAIGGRVNGNYAHNLDVNEAYSPQSNRWERLSPIPTARSGIAAAVLEGRIFVVGGEATTWTFHQVESYDATPWAGSSDPRRAHVRDFRRPDPWGFVFGSERDFHALTPSGEFRFEPTSRDVPHWDANSTAQPVGDTPFLIRKPRLTSRST